MRWGRLKILRLRPSIGLVLIAGFGGLMLAAVGLTLFLGFSSATYYTRALLGTQAETLLDQLVGGIRAELDPIVQEGDWVASRVAAGAVDPADTIRWDAFVSGILAGSPQLAGIAYLTADGQARMFRRRTAGVSVEDWSGRPIVARELSRLSDDPAAKGEPFWDEPSLAPGHNQVVLARVTPLVRGGKPLGWLYQGVTISGLSQRLAKAAAGSGVVPFVLYGGTRVLAHERLIRPEHGTGVAAGERGGGRRAAPTEPFVGDAAESLPKLAQLGDPYLAEIWSPDTFTLEFMSHSMASQMRGVWVNGQRRVFVFREISGYGPQPWTIGAHFSPDVPRAEVRRLFWSGTAALVILVIAVIAALLLARVTRRPILRLADAAGRVRRGDLAGLEPLPPTRLKELGEATRAFNGMVEGLRERDMIRRLFGKYVPETVAASLVKEGGAVHPQSARATILFVDLAGFTAMSEQMEPADIVEVLNSYFSRVVEILEAHGGVVTQFQGDAILAIFNVPIADAEHAANAVKAAIGIQRAVAEDAFAGRRLACRVGINTGDVVAGSVGASGRLNYTVHGDAVNLAARLEQLNKEHGTSILISQATADLIDGFDLRPMGSVPIRGKSAEVVVYRVGVDAV